MIWMYPGIAVQDVSEESPSASLDFVQVVLLGYYGCRCGLVLAIERGAVVGTCVEPDGLRLAEPPTNLTPYERNRAVRANRRDLLRGEEDLVIVPLGILPLGHVRGARQIALVGFRL